MARRRARTPLLLAANELERSLDAFPREFGAILADHLVVAGSNPFDGLRVDPADVRRACEVQTRSHLLHLREGFTMRNDQGVAMHMTRRTFTELVVLAVAALPLTGCS